MPHNHRLWLYEVDRVTPIGKHSLHQDPERAIAVLNPGASRRTLQHYKLVSKCGVLEDEFLAVLNEKPHENERVS